MASNKSKPLPPLSTENLRRFSSKVRVGKAKDCWPWTGSLDTHGYGQLNVRVGSKIHHVGVHRIAYFLATGEDPAPFHVLHSCDNPPCCNGAHLFKGTHQQNIEDATRKGRMRKPADVIGRVHPELFAGENSPAAKLTTKQVLEIRAKYRPHVVSRYMLAREYGVSPMCIAGIIYRQRWKFV